ncbi:ABC transporter permease, partial [Methylobacterium sp. EM32]
MHVDIATETPALPAASAKRAWARTLDNALGPLIEIPAALLVVAEVVVLLAGVVSRYVFHAPIVWSDEL